MLAQTYSNWELCPFNGSRADSPIRSILEEYQKKDPRIKVVFNEKQLQISDNTNAAIGIATGNYIAFADHDDTLAEEAFYQMAKEISPASGGGSYSSDEDIIDIRGNRLFPHFKPDFNPDYLCCVNYICHLVVVKRTLLAEQDFCGQNMTVPRTLIFCFAARSIQTVRRSAIFPKFCITGEAMRVPQRAIRMTSHMQ